MYLSVKIARDISRLSLATVALTAMLQDTGLFPVAAFESAIRTFQKAAIAETNLKAAAAGAELVRGTE